MLDMLRRILNFQLSVAELAGIALIVGTPYLAGGVVWSATHAAHLRPLDGLDLVVSALGSIVLWPVLLAADICITG